MKTTILKLKLIAVLLATAALPNLSLAQVGQVTEGPIAGGGGNSTSKNVTYDTYARRVDQLRGYQQVVVPALERIKKTLPELYQRLLIASRVSGFYVVPQKILFTLPAYKTGIPFDVNDQQQTAYNINDEVWFDSNKLNAKTEEDAGNLVLHELFMLDLMGKYADSRKLHSAIRRIGSYFRLYVQLDESEAKMVANAIYGSELFSTATELRAKQSEREEADASFVQLRNSVYVAIIPRCNQMPSLFDFEKLQPEQKLGASLHAGKILGQVEEKLRYLAHSGDVENEDVKKALIRDLSWNRFKQIDFDSTTLKIKGVRYITALVTAEKFFTNSNPYAADAVAQTYVELYTLCKEAQKALTK